MTTEHVTGEQVQPIISDERLAEIERWCRVSSAVMASDLRALVARMRAAEAERDIHRRQSEVRGEELRMESHDRMLFDGIRDQLNNAQKAWRHQRDLTDAAEAENERLRAKVARAEARSDLLAYRLDAVAEALADDWDRKAGRSLHDAVSRAIRLPVPVVGEEGDRG